MKILATCLDLKGHVGPMFVLVAALRKKGHSVVFHKFPSRLQEPRRMSHWIRSVHENSKEQIPILENYLVPNVDLVLADHTIAPAKLIAREKGKQFCTFGGSSACLRPSDVPMYAPEAILTNLPVSDPFSLVTSSKHYIQGSVESFDIPRPFANVQYVGPFIPSYHGSDHAAFQLPTGSKKKVLITPGTLSVDPEWVEHILAMLPKDVDAYVDGARPRKGICFYQPFCDHDLYMPLMDMVITKGGYGTIQRAIHHRKPILVVGHDNDWTWNGFLVQRAGIGLFRPGPILEVTDIENVLFDDSRYQALKELTYEAHHIGPATENAIKYLESIC